MRKILPNCCRHLFACNFLIWRFRTPVWCINVPTAFVALDNGKGGAAFFLPDIKSILMKTFEMLPMHRNADELLKITELIKECVQPVSVILYGHYAETKFANITGGYELLVITEHTISLQIGDVYNYINQHYPKEKRTEKGLFIYLLSTGFMNSAREYNYFLNTILSEGVMLYCAENFRINDQKLNLKKIITKTVYESTQNIELGNTLLQFASQSIANNAPHQAIFLLYQATRVFLTGIANVFCGFIPLERGNLYHIYSWIRFCQQELAEVWNFNNPLNKHSLKRMETFNEKARYNPDFRIYPEEVYCLS